VRPVVWLPRSVRLSVEGRSIARCPDWRRRRKRRWGSREGAGAIAPVENLHSTATSAETVRPVELCMKSMRNTTGLGSGAGVVVLCRFSVTLSAQSRGFGAGAAQTTLRRPATSPHPPSFPAPFPEPIASRRSRGRGPRVRRPSPEPSATDPPTHRPPAPTPLLRGPRGPGRALASERPSTCCLRASPGCR
jgi:hypothetical protein